VSNDFKMDDYIDVAERLQEFRAKHPEGSCQQVDLKFIDFAGKSWVVFTAAAYRTPDDPRPGHGTAWEPVPGKTPFTRDSELQNAETAAWGRAIVAALAADTKRGVASAQEVRNRRVDRDEPAPANDKPMDDKTRGQMFALFTDRGIIDRESQINGICHVIRRQIKSRSELSQREAEAVIASLKGPK
jgi:hypothetical protein